MFLCFVKNFIDSLLQLLWFYLKLFYIHKLCRTKIYINHSEKNHQKFLIKSLQNQTKKLTKNNNFSISKIESNYENFSGVIFPLPDLNLLSDQLKLSATRLFSSKLTKKSKKKRKNRKKKLKRNKHHQKSKSRDKGSQLVKHQTKAPTSSSSHTDSHKQGPNSRQTKTRADENNLSSRRLLNQKNALRNGRFNQKSREGVDLLQLGRRWVMFLICLFKNGNVKT